MTVTSTYIHIIIQPHIVRIITYYGLVEENYIFWQYKQNDTFRYLGLLLWYQGLLL